MTDLIVNCPIISYKDCYLEDGDLIKVTTKCRVVFNENFSTFIDLYESMTDFEESLKYTDLVYSRASTDIFPVEVNLMFLGKCTRELRYGKDIDAQTFFKFLVVNSTKVVWLTKRVTISLIKDSKALVPYYWF